MARITVYMTLPDEDIVTGWNSGAALEETVKATLHELIGDDGGAYVPYVFGIDVEDDPED